MTTTDRWALQSLGVAALASGLAYAVSYRHARRRFPGQLVSMNQPDQARYEGATSALAFGGATLLLGSALLRAAGV